MQARAAFSGHWRGYPLKLTVKYLGAHLQDNGSLRAEIQRRISHAKAGFAQYALFFKLKRVPIRRKIAVFKAVVNESLLSALEVRPVSVSDIRQLEQARGLLLRRLFGREGFGSVANDHEHRSVTVSSLRQRAHLATVASELRVRRLLWLRRALLAEQQGQTRLELATLFGTSSTLRSCVALDSGEPTSYAPRFLHLLHSDLKHVWASYPGFRDNWKSGFLAIPYALLQGLRTTHSCDDDGRAPPQPEAPAPPLIMAEFRCEQCGAGPWPTQRALRSHMVTRHKHRHPVQGQTCPLCQRTFTTKTAAQRHFDRRSCGSLVCNHGHAGALEGQRQREAVPARVPPAPAAPQLQARLDRFSSCLAMPLDFLQPAASPVATRAPKRIRQEGVTQGRAKPIEDQVHDLRQQLQKVCQLVAHHDTSLRELDSWSTYTVLLGSDTDLAKTLVLHLEQWKGQLPPRGQPHPLGPARHTVAGALAQWLLSAEPRRQAMPGFQRLHDAMAQHADLSKSVQLCYIKTIKDGRLLLKVRPQQCALAEWQEAFAWIDASLSSLEAETKGVAPPGPLARAVAGKHKQDDTHPTD